MRHLTPRKVNEGVRRVLLTMKEVRQSAVIDSWGLLPDRSVNPLTAHPRCYWSQSDEDGILEEILLRTGPSDEGVFIEYGVGNGAQCNTVALLAKGWQGAWISGEDLMFSPREGGRLAFEQAWITRDNIMQLTNTALARLSGSDANDPKGVDVVSLDLDGNDLHLAEVLLKAGIMPRVWIAEYNARFPVGTYWVMDYDASHTWKEDDFYGASISAFASAFRDHGYFPVACSVSGANVFFVRDDFRGAFDDVPQDLRTLYQPQFSASVQWGHKISARTLESLT